MVNRPTWSRVGLFHGSVVVLLLVSSCLALDDPEISPGLFYPFGRDVGDEVIPVNDDGSSGSVPIDIGFPFFASNNTELHVNTNGAISFGKAVKEYTPTPFPIENRLIAPYWCDVDTTRNTGRVYFRQSRDVDLLNRATSDVLGSFSARGLYAFKAKWIFVATWHKVTYYGGNSFSPVNSFQAVLITDGRHSFAVFNYGRLTWTTGTSSGGNVATGLGGTAAQAGFNAGDRINFFAIPGSQTAHILEVASESNIGHNGRWMFQVESAKIQMDNTCQHGTGKCKAYQRFDENKQGCSDVAPAFECPTLEGPIVDRRVWVEFHCVIPTNETKNDAVYEVTFLFNGQPDAKVPGVQLRPPKTRATLHEEQLHLLLGKWISCKVQSRWSSTKSTSSQELTSVNNYFAGIEVSPQVLSVHEGYLEPAIVTLTSTIPVTCSDAQVTACDHVLRFKTSDTNIVLLQEDNSKCAHTMRKDDWKRSDGKTYRLEYQIKLYARVDRISSRPRSNSLIVWVDPVPGKKKAPDGKDYTNMWKGYADTAPVVQVYHHDGPHAVCRATGDPNLTTFDRVFYAVYDSGQFTYVQTTSGPKIEIQVRHKPCGQVVSCACAVAARENDVILIVDKCADNFPHTVTPNDPSTLPEGATITVDKSGRSFTIHLPSDVKVVGYFTSWGMNIEIQLTPAGFNRTRGLCGTFDHDKSNDLWAKGQPRPTTKISDLNTVVESWKLATKKSLFDGHKSKDLSPEDSTQRSAAKTRSYCICGGNEHGECGSDKRTNNNDPTARVRRETNEVQQAAGISNELPRRRRNANTDVQNGGRLSFDVDWRYNSSAFYDLPKNLGSYSSVSQSTLTESEARVYCRRVIWDDLPLKRLCEGRVNQSDVMGIIDKCVRDIQMTGDTSWADDKIQEVEDLCLFETLTMNITESNMTVENLTAAIKEMSSALNCLPPDCSGHGECSQGNCVCHNGYIGVDCAIDANAVPNIIDVLSKSSCDVDNFHCEKVEFLADGVAAMETLTCRVDVTKLDNSKQSINTNGHLKFPGVAYCDLPTDRFQAGLRSLQRRRRSPPNASAEEGGGLGFHSLPPGNPAMLYSVAISNDRRLYSQRILMSISESKCYEYSGGSWMRKKDTCLISGYCFTRDDTNPFNPDCEFCEPVKTPDKWTKRPDSGCDPCSSSPCHGNGVCISPFKDTHHCVGSTQSRGFVILSLGISVASVILLVFVVMFVIHWRNKTTYKSI